MRESQLCQRQDDKARAAAIGPWASLICLLLWPGRPSSLKNQVVTRFRTQLDLSLPVSRFSPSVVEGANITRYNYRRELETDTSEPQRLQNRRHHEDVELCRRDGGDGERGHC